MTLSSTLRTRCSTSAIAYVHACHASRSDDSMDSRARVVRSSTSTRRTNRSSRLGRSRTTQCTALRATRTSGALCDAILWQGIASDSVVIVLENQDGALARRALAHHELLDRVLALQGAFRSAVMSYIRPLAAAIAAFRSFTHCIRYCMQSDRVAGCEFVRKEHPAHARVPPRATL